jgi:segregation and condensation protein A
VDVNADYTVRLDQVFQGPMDLLLHLVKEQEVDIAEVDLHLVIDQYLAYLKDLRDVDVEVAGDFLVMAATLMAIKSRSLLPREEVDLARELDPRDELIRRLIEYRHFKQASRDLSERFDERARLFPHGSPPRGADEPSLDVSDVSAWDLLSAFSKLLRETLAHRPLVIQSDERPLRYWVDRLVERLERERVLTLRQVVEDVAAGGAAAKPALIGTFCALLELIKLGVVNAHQVEAHGDIAIRVRDDVAGDIDEIVANAGLADEELAEPDRVAPARAREQATLFDSALPDELDLPAAPG